MSQERGFFSEKKDKVTIDDRGVVCNPRFVGYIQLQVARDIIYLFSKVAACCMNLVSTILLKLFHFGF